MKNFDVVVADDHPMCCQAIKDIFIRRSEINFIGEANNGIALLELVEQKTPDVAIIDLTMPDMDGYETILNLHTLYPEMKIIACSGFLDSKNQQRVINMGAHASISKSESSEKFIEAMDAVLNNKTYHSRTSDDWFMEKCEDKKENRLTMREEQIMMLIAQGKTSRQISEILNISQWTVDKHRSNIKEKLGLNNLAEMIRYAILNI